jgi:hypothetical protein
MGCQVVPVSVDNSITAIYHSGCVRAGRLFITRGYCSVERTLVPQTGIGLDHVASTVTSFRETLLVLMPPIGRSFWRAPAIVIRRGGCLQEASILVCRSKSKIRSVVGDSPRSEARRIVPDRLAASSGRQHTGGWRGFGSAGHVQEYGCRECWPREPTGGSWIGHDPPLRPPAKSTWMT